jgi:hypothetical protein
MPAAPSELAGIPSQQRHIVADKVTKMVVHASPGDSIQPTGDRSTVIRPANLRDSSDARAKLPLGENAGGPLE